MQGGVAQPAVSTRPGKTLALRCLDTMRFAIPDELLNELRPWRVTLRERGSSNPQKYEAFRLYHGPGTICYLTTGGRVLVKTGRDGGKPLREASDAEAFKAIALAASIAETNTPQVRGVTTLLDLLPKAPSDATACARCEGTRCLETFACDTCNGLGWTLPPRSEFRGLYDAVREFIRRLGDDVEESLINGAAVFDRVRHSSPGDPIASRRSERFARLIPHSYSDAVWISLKISAVPVPDGYDPRVDTERLAAVQGHEWRWTEFEIGSSNKWSMAFVKWVKPFVLASYEAS